MTARQRHDDPQVEKFKEAAREIGADVDEARWDEKLGKLVKHKPRSEKLK